MNQNDNEMNASWDGVKLFLTEKFKSDMMQFAGERDANKAQEFRDNIRKILDFIRTVKDARKRANASAMPVDNTQPFGFQDNGQPSVNPLGTGQPSNNPFGIQPSVNQSNNPLGIQPSVNPLGTGQPSNNPFGIQPSVNQSNNPLGIQPSVNPLGTQPSVNPLGTGQPSNNPLGTSDKPLNAGIQQKKPDEPSVFSGLKNLFGGKARTLRHRAYYNNTLRNFR
jgi:hypothetical protein